jgi:hypothetical protein
MDLLIYLEERNSRIDYIFNHIFQHVLGLKISLTTDLEFFNNSNLSKIEYSKKQNSDALFFEASDLLFETDIRKQNLTVSTYKKTKVFFQCSDSSVLPFDPFAASFYMLTRYEEYVSNITDDLGRFPAIESLAYTHNFLNIPVVDYWILHIKRKLKDRFAAISFKEHTFQFINTIDIDNAFAYLEKGFLRTLGACLKDIFKLHFKNLKQRLEVIFFNKKDPYDTYENLLHLHTQYKLNTVFFFLLGDYGKYDKNIPFSSKKLQSIIQKVYRFCLVGIHASYQSLKSPKKLHKEINRLQSILNQDVTLNRQHFLCLNIPENYKYLIQHNIKNDYSMGFPSLPGFRAGTSYSFYFFDLKNNESTDLKIHPFSIMDATLNYYMQLNPHDSLEVIKNIIDEIKQVNGTFISIWHNESLNYTDSWKGWDNIYEHMIQYIVDEKN